MTDRQMPSNKAAEVQILGAILLDNSCFDQAGAVLNAEDFSLDSHRRIYLAMEAMVEKGTKIDFTLLEEELKRKKELESVGGPGYVESLTDNLPRVKNIEQYVAIVRDKARARMLIHACNSAIASAYDQSEKSDDTLAGLQEELLKLIHHGSAQDRTLAEIGTAAWEQFERMWFAGSKCIGLSSGIEPVDTYTTGFRKDYLVIIGARPSSGKTSLACQSIRTNCKAGKKCGFFSLEMSAEQIIFILACMETKIDSQYFLDNRALREPEMQRVARAITEIKNEWPLVIDDTTDSLKGIAAKSRLWASRGTEAIYVDYLQLMEAPGKDRYHVVTNIARGLKKVAKTCHVPVVALSQLSRTKGEEPTMEDLRESGQIEQDADLIGLLHRGKDETGFTGEDKIIIAKHRNGPAGRHIPVWFDAQHRVFKPRTETTQ